MGGGGDSTPPKLTFNSFFASESPEPPGMLTPPLRPPVSIPFQWESAPGKPRTTRNITPNTTNNTTTNPSYVRSLELPPRLLAEGKMTNIPSPTTVLEGPYMGRSVSVSFSSSFCRDHFSSPHEEGLKGGGGGGIGGVLMEGFYGYLRKIGMRGNKQVGVDSFDISSNDETCLGGEGKGRGEVKVGIFKRSGSLISRSNTKSSHLWTAGDSSGHETRFDYLSWGALAVAPEMLALSPSFSKFSFQFFSRSFNSEAHALTALGVHSPAFSLYEPHEATKLIDYVVSLQPVKA
ncbi:hypothetical protein GIB67_033408 [Kingdonia uniflora]|uniref:Uncharacterized protein n=1 Tax=Kingdonia uniflora TaxID=39325 RepID=A0A7J7LTY2_9MAGN|nr:hypothetical protein GIB67_033408 [Kingdonia uniflora]